MDGKTVIFAGRPSAQEIHSRMSPACLVGVAGTGELYHIRRHGFPCGKRCGSRPCEYAQAHEHGHEQGQGLSQCFSSCYLLEMAAKKAHRFRCAAACVGYCLKKRGPPGFPRSPMSACGKETGAFYKHPGSPNIFFFRLFRLFGRGEVWRGGTGTSCCSPQMGALPPCEWAISLNCAGVCGKVPAP